MLIDDFTRRDGRSALGPSWTLTTDRAVGGGSAAHAALTGCDGRAVLRLTGQVLPAERPVAPVAAHAFVTVSLAWARPLDADAQAALVLHLRGNGGAYWAAWRTTDLTLPWQAYRQSFTTTGAWQTVTLALDEFEPVAALPPPPAYPFDPTRLTELSLGAGPASMAVDLAIAEVRLAVWLAG